MKFLPFLLLGILVLIHLNASAQTGSDGVNSYADSALIRSEKKVFLENIFVVGNARTRQEIILREINLFPGTFYSLKDLHEQMIKDRRLVFNTQLFLSVQFHLHELSETNVLLVVEVKERQYLLPIPVLTLADRNFSDWVINRNMDLKRINFGLRVYHDNLTGRNDKLRVSILQGFTRQYDIRYSLPYLEKTQKHGLSFTAALARNNIVAVETIDHLPRFIDFRKTARDLRTAGFTYTYRPNYYSFHDFGGSFTRIQTLDTIAEINPNYFGEGRTQQQFFRIFYQYRRDVRDAINYPLRGSNLSLIIEKFGLGGGNDVDFTQITASYARYLPLGREFYFGTSASGRLMSPREQPYNRLIALGFRQFYVRSFELDLIEGHRYLLQKNTLKKKLIGRSYTLPRPFDKTPFSTIPFAFYLKTFVDHGWVGNRLDYPLNQRLINRYLIGYGIGLDLVTYYDLVFKLEYSRNNVGTGGLFLNFRADF